MSKAMRGAVALCLAVACLLALPVLAQAPGNERERVSYMVGMDVGQSLQQVGPDLDVGAFGRALVHAIGGGQPLLDDAATEAVRLVLSLRVAHRSGQPLHGLPPGSEPPDIDRGNVGLLLGHQIGRSLLPLREELELPVVLRAVGDVVQGRELQMTEAEAEALRPAFTARARERIQAEAARVAERNRAEGEAFLAANRGEPGVITTASGLQYKVLREGGGPRPLPTGRVRVHYHGTLLDGTVFDSSVDRNQPAEFGLREVIPGWTEGVALMPVGAKYRFWIPGALGYGTSGTPGGPIGPNATLVFDVELLDVL